MDKIKMNEMIYDELPLIGNKLFASIIIFATKGLRNGDLPISI